MKILIKTALLDSSALQKWFTSIPICNLKRKHSTYSDKEVEKFSSLASRWWDRHGELKALHSMNKVRVPFIRDNVLLQGLGTPNTGRPLEGISILDVGCGAGILSESLSRLGASVLGIDPSSEAIHTAKIHRDGDPDLAELQYLDSPLEDIVSLGSLDFDCVVASEVIEHSSDPHQFIELCVRLLRPKGSIFISTINRTCLSRLLAITVAENLLGIVPPSTHSWKKFITPTELTEMLSKNDCHVRKMLGCLYNPLTNQWQWSGTHDVNYILHAMKAGDV